MILFRPFLSIVVSLVGILSFAAAAELSRDDLALAESERRYVTLERQWLECGVGRNKQAIFSSYPEAKNQLAYSFKTRIANELNQMSCSSGRQTELWREMNTIARANSAHPYLYSSTIDINHIQNRQEAIEKRTEKFFKNRSFASCPATPLSFDQLTSPLYLHAYLLKYGLPCTTQRYKSSSRRLFSSNTAQRAFDATRDVELVNLNLRGMNVVIVPHLSYERSQLNALPFIGHSLGGEKINYQSLSEKLLASGASDVQIMYRNSTADIELQAAQTLQELKAYLQTHDNVVIVSRSFGAAVLNYIFNSPQMMRQLDLRKIRSWINVGGTPYGSTISDYKSRSDQFYAVLVPEGLSLLNRFSNVVRLFLDILTSIDENSSRQDVERFLQFAINGLNRPNIESMSLRNPRFLNSLGEKQNSAVQNQLKVYNVVFLINDIFQRTVSTDPVLQNMLAYGPTEGSAPLYGATVDTERSARVFVNRDHLIFRDLSRQNAERLILKTMLAAQKSGLL